MCGQNAAVFTGWLQLLLQLTHFDTNSLSFFSLKALYIYVVSISIRESALGGRI